MELEARHANIKDPEFSVQFFKSFDIVFNALDNLGTHPPLHFAVHAWKRCADGWGDARRHVNRMCLAADVPLIESGTTGFQGQVQPIVKVTPLMNSKEGELTVRGKQSVTIVIQKRFPSRFRSVLSVQRHRNQSTVSSGPNHTFSHNSLASTKNKSPR